MFFSIADRTAIVKILMNISGERGKYSFIHFHYLF